MPSDYAYLILAGILSLLLVWERVSRWFEQRAAWDRMSELMERIHRKDRMDLVATQRPVEAEPVELPMADPGSPPNNGMSADDAPMLPPMTDETEAWIEQMQKQGLPQGEILRRLQGSR